MDHIKKYSNKNTNTVTKKISLHAGSKTNKKTGTEPNKKYKKKDTNKKTTSGSKTSKPIATAKQKELVKQYEVDVDEIFDIIKSPKEKEKIVKKNAKDIIKIDTKIKNIVDKDNENKEALSGNINNKSVQTYLEAKQFLKDRNITISTITLDCKLHTLIDVDRFAKNVILKEDGIVSVKFGNRKDSATNRTIVILKAKKKPSTKNFYNQVTILMKPTNNPNHNYINIKVFKNGSLQMTGCKDMDDFNNVTNKLIEILKRGKDITDRKGKKCHIDFIDSPDKIGIFDVKIRMINSNFRLDYKVDRKKLARLLKKNHRIGTKDKEIGYVECKYEPTGGHSCVNIKYQYDDKSKPSIFVFQTGAVIITGAKNLHHIIMAYHFINKILDCYNNEIRIVDLDPNVVRAEINKFLKLKKSEQKIEI